MKTDNTLRDEIIDILKDVYHNNDGGDPFDETDADRILSLINNRIDNMIKVDIETFNRNLGTNKEGKIAAQASKNTLILIKEMLKN